MNIAIMTSGGDSSGMNPAIKAFVEMCYERGDTPYFIYEGLEGLIDNKIKKASLKDVENIIFLGGTIIKSSRSKRFFDKKYRKIAYKNLKNYKIKKLIILGGDGSFRALDKIHKEAKIDIIGIPATIDNDIAKNEYSIGVDTALNVIRSAIDDIRDTASSFKRAFVIEVMGRECGYLAMISALTSGADICLIPEIDTSINFKLKEKDYYIAIVAEGVKKTDELKEFFEKKGIDVRVSILGHIQRGGNPTTYERLMAYEFINIALNTKKCGIVTFSNNKFKVRTIDEVVNNTYKLNSYKLSLVKKLNNHRS
jgi:6-phosphofructokinase 1